MELFVNNIQIAFKLKTLIFPLDVIKFQEKLNQNGYRSVRRGQQTPDGLPIKPGDIVLKNNTIINVNSQSQTITVTGTNNEELISVLREIIPFLNSAGVDIEKHVRAYSVMGEYIVTTDKNASEQIQKLTKPVEIKELSNMADLEPANFSISLVPKGKSMIDEEYYQLRIEPYIQGLGKSYFIQFSRRNPNRKTIEGIIINFENHVKEIINQIES